MPSWTEKVLRLGAHKEKTIELSSGVQVPVPSGKLLEQVGDTPEGYVYAIGHLRQEIISLLGRCKISIEEFDSILDFGCGLGRFLIAMQPLLRSQQRLFGAEVVAERALWCQLNLPFATVVNNPLHPPLPFSEGQFDFLYALSVFTHLRLDLQFAWAAEIDRVLMPGGVAFFSTHGPSFFPSFLAHHDGQSACFSLVNVGDSGLFASLIFGKGADEIQGQREVAIAHHPDLISSIFPGFEVLSYFPRTILAGGQDVFVIRKPRQTVRRILPESGEVQVIRRLANDPHPKFRFTVFGQQTFRCFVAVEPDGYFPMQLSVHIRFGDESKTITNMPLNANRIFGATQFIKVEFPLPGYEGSVEIELQVSSQSASAPETVIWLHPACY